MGFSLPGLENQIETDVGLNQNQVNTILGAFRNVQTALQNGGAQQPPQAQAPLTRAQQFQQAMNANPTLKFVVIGVAATLGMLGIVSIVK